MNIHEGKGLERLLCIYAISTKLLCAGSHIGIAWGL